MLPIILTVLAPDACAPSAWLMQHTEVVVAAHGLFPGRRLDGDGLCVATIPTNAVPEGALSVEALSRGPEEILAVPLAKGSVITERMLRPRFVGLTRTLTVDAKTRVALAQGDLLWLLGEGEDGEALSIDGVSVISVSKPDEVLVAIPKDTAASFEAMRTRRERIEIRRLVRPPVLLADCRRRWGVDALTWVTASQLRPIESPRESLFEQILDQRHRSRPGILP